MHGTPPSSHQVDATDPRRTRRLLLLVSTIIVADTMLYSAVAPLLPHYAETLDLSKSAAGVLLGAYPAGMLLGSVPGGLMATRIGARPTVLVGLGVLAVSSLAFGFGSTAGMLTAARFLQGLGGACSWCAALTWLLRAAPVRQRGLMLGTALGAGIGGSLLGPVLGAMALELSPAVVFASVAALSGGLAVAVLLTEGPRPGRRQGVGDLARAAARPAVRSAAWLVVLPSIGFGCISVLGPLRLDDLGATGTAIAATFLVAAAAEAGVSPVVGAISDRRGRLTPIKVGLLAVTVLSPLFLLPRSAPVLAVMLVLLAVSLGMFWAPAMALLVEAAEGTSLDKGLALALVNLAWAGGVVLGASAGGALAQRTSDAVPVMATAVLCLLTYGVTSNRPTHPGDDRVRAAISDSDPTD